MSHLCSVYLGLTSLEHPQSEPWTCHQEETMKFRNQEALEEASGPTGFMVTDRHTPGTTYHWGNWGFPTQFHLHHQEYPEFGKCYRKSNRKSFFTKLCVAYCPWAKGKDLRTNKTSRSPGNIWGPFSMRSIMDPSSDMRALCSLFNPSRVIF